MRNTPLQLPWTLGDVPHAVLDILRGCNIHCRDCYNLRPDRVKPLAEIEAQLNTLMTLRKLQSVSVVGGEITLHPDLEKIVRLIRRRGLFVELFTNGVGLNEELVVRLKQAGANVIFLHIEPDQRRPDLPSAWTQRDLTRLRSEKASLIARHGIEVGLAITAYPEKLLEVEEAVAFALASPQVCYLLVTWWRNVRSMPSIRGDLVQGMVSDSNVVSGFAPQPDLGPQEICRWLERRFGLTPFAFLGSNLDRAEPRWLSSLVGTVHHEGELTGQQAVQSTWVERAFLQISRKLTGRYPFYQRQRAWQIALHLLMNGLASGSTFQKLKLIGRAARPGGRLHAKRLLFQWPAAVDERGRVVHCHCCPDAVVKEGRLVPLCISDLVMAKESNEPAPVLANS